jgi:FixJ family two-component response regulator
MTESEPTVFVVDDDPGVADSIRLLLHSVGLKSESFLSAKDFLDAYQSDRTGCLILDVRMPGMSGLDLQEHLQQMKSTLPIIFVTAHADVPMAVGAVKAGAVDFIQKPFRDQELLDKIQAAMELHVHVKAEEQELTEINSRLESLTPREIEVMDLVVEGVQNKKIARVLGISKRTVEIHRARVMQKMKVGSVPLLVQLVMRSREKG